MEKVSVEIAQPETVAALAPELGQVLHQIHYTPIDSLEREKWGVDAVKVLRQRVTQLKKERDSVANPLKDALAKVKNWWDPGIKEGEKCIKLLSAKVFTFRKALEAEQQKALSEATTQAEVTQATEVLAPPAPAGSHQRAKWIYRITNVALIPREYWILDEKRIAAEVRAAKEKTNIPGIEAYNDPTGVIRS